METFKQGRPETGGPSRQVHNLSTLKTDILKTIWPGVEELFRSACPNYRKFSEELFHMWNPEFTSTVFPFILVTS